MSNDPNKLPSVNKSGKKEENSGLDYKQRFLGNVSQRFTGEETSRWLNALNDAEKLVEESSVKTKDGSSSGNLTVFALIDKLFDNFQRYSYEFNKNCQGTKYAVSVERPGAVKEKRTWGTEHVDRYTVGRLAAMEWGLLVFGTDQLVTAYVMKTKYLLSFNPEESDFAPYMTIEGTNKGWTIDGQNIAADSIPSIARCLFSFLVMVARGEAGPAERFSLARVATAPIPTGTAAHPFLREHAVEEESFSLQKEKDDQEVLGRQSGVQERPKPTGDLNLERSFQGERVDMFASQLVKGAAGTSLDDNNNAIGTNVTHLISTIDQQLEVLPEISAHCMRSQDMPGVVQCMKRSQALTTLRARLIEFRDEWLGILKERG